MSKLLQKQFEFTRALADLLKFITSLGFEATTGDSYRDPRTNGAYGIKKGYSHARSTHKKRLAQDLNVFHKNGKIVSPRDDVWVLLHNFWEKIGGSPIIHGDPYHFSFKWNGVR